MESMAGAVLPKRLRNREKVIVDSDYAKSFCRQKEASPVFSF